MIRSNVSRHLSGVGWEWVDQDSELSQSFRERKAWPQQASCFVLNNLKTDGKS